MRTPFSVLMLAAIRHPLDYPLAAELVFALVVLTACVLAVVWHHGKRAAHQFNTWWYCRQGARELLRELQDATEAVDSRPQMPGHVPQPRRRIPLRRLPMRTSSRPQTRKRVR